MTAHQLASRKLGADGPRVSAIGLGCMGMSDAYGHADEAESIATIHAALDEGITLLDTGDAGPIGAELSRSTLMGGHCRPPYRANRSACAAR